MKNKKLLAGGVSVLLLALMLSLLAPVTGCVGYVGPDGYGGPYYGGPDVAVFGGFRGGGGGHWHDASFRGAHSRHR